MDKRHGADWDTASVAARHLSEKVTCVDRQFDTYDGGIKMELELFVASTEIMTIIFHIWFCRIFDVLRKKIKFLVLLVSCTLNYLNVPFFSACSSYVSQNLYKMLVNSTENYYSVNFLYAIILLIIVNHLHQSMC